MLLCLCLIAIGLAYTAADESVPNRCPQPTAFDPDPVYYHYGHPTNCSVFYTCAHGIPYKQSCGPGAVWSDFFETCVGYNSHYDTCTQSNPQRECDRQQGQFLLIPHKWACQRYYNCSDIAVPGQFSFFGRYEKECEYPKLFDATEKRCKFYKDAYCGPGRTAAKDPCDYLMNLCGTSHCQPCSSRLPSCVGQLNGRHEHPERLWTPYFINCFDERLVSVQTCRNLDTSSVNVIFSPATKACVPLTEVPRQFGGLA